MIKKSLHTIVSKFGIAGINFLILLLTAKYLGAEIRGEISLYILGIGIVAIVTNIVAGPAIVYSISKVKDFNPFPNFLIVLLTSIFSSFVYLIFDDFCNEHSLHFILTSILLGIFTYFQNIIIARNKIEVINILSFFQVFLFFTLLVLGIFYLKWASFSLFKNGLLLSFFIILIPSASAIRFEKWQIKLSQFDIIKSNFKQGVLIQTATLSSVLSNRFQFYILMMLFGKFQVGIFGVILAISEALLIVSKSLSLIQYAEISQQSDLNSQKKLTIKMLFTSLAATFILCIILITLPDYIFEMAFGEDFQNLKQFFIYLIPAILLMSANSSFVHFFSGIGKNKINSLSSFLSLIVVLLSTYYLIFYYEIIGASFSYLIGNLISFSILIFHFYRQNDMIDSK